jgi:CRP/FNR family transcriptional regulator, cyclic AMP receptor protein
MVLLLVAFVGDAMPAAATDRASVTKASMRRQFLASHELFRHLDGVALDRLASHVRPMRLARGTAVFRKGDEGTGLVAVVSGRIKIVTQTLEGKEAVLNLINPGEVFGEIALLDGRPRTADAIALSDCEVLVLERRDFIPFLRDNPDVGLHLMAVLCHRLRRTTEQVEDVMFLDLPARLAKVIQRFVVDPQGRLQITQRELGQMIGVSRESTNKELRRWQRKGWISLEKNGLIVRRPDMVARIAEGG